MGATGTSYWRITSGPLIQASNAWSFGVSNVSPLTTSKLTMNAGKLFEEMKAYVDAACKEKDYSLAVQAAEKSGFRSVPRSSTSSVLADLRYKDVTGSEIWLVAKWHDPSGPFQNLPDVNRIRLTLSVPGRPLIEYMGEYED